MRSRFLTGVGLFAALVAFTSSLTPPLAAKQPPAKGVTAKADALRKYDDVITKDFTTSPGVFVVHRNDDKLYFEIPQDKLGRLFLWQAVVAKGPGGGMFGSWGGANLGSAVLKLKHAGTSSSCGRSRSRSGPTGRRSRPASTPPRPTRSSSRSTSSARARTGRR